MRYAQCENIKFEKITVALLLCGAIIGGGLFGFITAEIKNFSGNENLKRFQPSVPTKLYDVNGELIAELFQEKRNLVSYDELPKTLINAFVATEDKDFYTHFGINPMAIIRAMVKNAMAGEIKQGGSTITQQLAKRLFTGGERTFTRKILEAVLALQIEKRFSKEEILEMYFNQIYLGHGCYGIDAASKLFFHKDVKYLGAAESSVLAALPSAPGKYSPLQNPHNAYEKNHDTLRRMVNEGYLTQQRADAIYRDFWPVFIDSIKTEYPTTTAFSYDDNQAPYFTEYVRQILIARFGKDIVYNEGLSVYTTLNLKRQLLGEKLVSEGALKQDEVSSRANQYYNSAVDRGLFGAYWTLRMVFNLPGVVVKNDIESTVRKQLVDEYLDELDIIANLAEQAECQHTLEGFRAGTSAISSSLKVQGAMIAIEPKTGYITTMVGGPEFSVSNQYNRAVQARRQPGSSFKPFVYGAGIESRIINAGTALPDAPIVDVDAGGETWTPANYEGNYSGMVTLRRALMASINIISVRIYDAIGADRIISYASRVLKVPESRFTPSPSLALGSTEMTPFEMASGYAIYANRGRDVIPYAIRYVIDRDGTELANIEEEVGDIIATKQMKGEMQIIPEDVAYVMTSLMRSVCDGGTAADALRVQARFTKPCAGKTGTTSNWTDAWFCGFTPDIAAVVWLGYDKPFMSLGKHQAGAGVAAPIWGNYMREVYNGMPDPVFSPQPESVTNGGVCRYTGLAPGPNCHEIIGELMIKGGYPTKVCDGEHFKMKSVLDTYMEKQGLPTQQE